MPSTAEIRLRDGSRCARCGSPRGLHVHHRRRRSQGGPDSWANLVTLCSGCHEWVHRYPAAARRGGWLVGGAGEPGAVPVEHALWPAGPVRLGEDGSIILVQSDTL